MGDSMMDLVLKSFKVKHRELTRDGALQECGKFSQFFAVELVYKNKPIRLIVAAENLPVELSPAAPRAEKIPQTERPGGPDQVTHGGDVTKQGNNGRSQLLSKTQPAASLDS